MKKIVLMLASGLILHSCSTNRLPTEPGEVIQKPVEVKSDPLPKENLKLGRKLTLWSTYYFTPILKSSSKEKYCLQGPDGSCVSPKISHAQMCFCQMQGSCIVDGGVFGYYSYAGTSWKKLFKSCKEYGRTYAGSNKVRFKLDKNTKFGKGSFNNELLPFTSIACPREFPNLTRIFIPSAKGVKLPNGRVHDGVFRCDDRGGAITGNHIDTFIGLVDMRENFKMNDWGRAWRANPFKGHVKSKSSGTFEAYIVE